MAHAPDDLPRIPFVGAEQPPIERPQDAVPHMPERGRIGGLASPKGAVSRLDKVKGMKAGQKSDPMTAAQQVFGDREHWRDVTADGRAAQHKVAHGGC